MYLKSGDTHSSVSSVHPSLETKYVPRNEDWLDRLQVLKSNKEISSNISEETHLACSISKSKATETQTTIGGLKRAV